MAVFPLQGLRCLVLILTSEPAPPLTPCTVRYKSPGRSSNPTPFPVSSPTHRFLFFVLSRLHGHPGAQVGLELTTLRSRPDLRSSVSHLTYWPLPTPAHRHPFQTCSVPPGPPPTQGPTEDSGFSAPPALPGACRTQIPQRTPPRPTLSSPPPSSAASCPHLSPSHHHEDEGHGGRDACEEKNANSWQLPPPRPQIYRPDPPEAHWHSPHRHSHLKSWKDWFVDLPVVFRQREGSEKKEHHRLGLSSAQGMWAQGTCPVALVESRHKASAQQWSFTAMGMRTGLGACRAGWGFPACALEASYQVISRGKEKGLKSLFLDHPIPVCIQHLWGQTAPGTLSEVGVCVSEKALRQKYMLSVLILFLYLLWLIISSFALVFCHPWINLLILIE